MWPGPYGVGGSRNYLLASLNASLRRMGLEHVDIFYSHRPTMDVPLEETMGALVQAVRQGIAWEYWSCGERRARRAKLCMWAYRRTIQSGHEKRHRF